MKSLGDIYCDSFEKKNKWYEIVWFYIAMFSICCWHLPGAGYRYLTNKEFRDIIKEAREARREFLKREK